MNKDKLKVISWPHPDGSKWFWIIEEDTTKIPILGPYKRKQTAEKRMKDLKDDILKVKVK